MAALPVSVVCRRGDPFRLVRHRESGGDAGVAQKPAAKITIKPNSAMHRRKVPPWEVNRTAKNQLAEPFVILENAALSVRLNIIDLDDVPGLKFVRYVQQDDRAGRE